MGNQKVQKPDCSSAVAYRALTAESVTLRGHEQIPEQILLLTYFEEKVGSLYIEISILCAAGETEKKPYPYLVILNIEKRHHNIVP